MSTLEGKPRAARFGVLRVLAWAYAIVIGLGGILGVFQGHVLTGLLLTASAIIALPLTVDLLEERFNIAIPRWLRVAGVIVLFLAAGETLPPTKDTTPTIAPSTETATQPSAPAPPVVAPANVESGALKAFSECLQSNAKDGQYSSFDGGKSALLLLAACYDPWKAYVDACVKSGSTGEKCDLASTAIAQVTLKWLGK